MIHKTAIIDSNAKVSSSAKIGAYSVIGPNVEIGDEVIIHSHVNISGNTKIGPKTNKMMKKQNVPREVIADGAPFEIYKRCGWEPPMGGSEENELTKRRDMVANNSSSEALEVMDRLSQEYFHEYLS